MKIEGRVRELIVMMSIINDKDIFIAKPISAGVLLVVFHHVYLRLGWGSCVCYNDSTQLCQQIGVYLLMAAGPVGVCVQQRTSNLCFYW